MIRRIDPDEEVAINGVLVSGRTLAEARQELSHRGVYNPRWAELSRHDQETAAMLAAGWLRALTELVAQESTPERLAELDRANPINYCGRCEQYVPAEESQPVPTTLAAPGGGVHYKRWHPQCVEAAKRDRTAKAASRVDLNDTSRCPVGDRCESCGGTDGLGVELATTQVGVYCLTLDADCAEAGRAPSPGGFPAAIGRVGAHCGHLGIDADTMAEAMETERERQEGQ